MWAHSQRLYSSRGSASGMKDSPRTGLVDPTHRQHVVRATSFTWPGKTKRDAFRQAFHAHTLLHVALRILLVYNAAQNPSRRASYMETTPPAIGRALTHIYWVLTTPSSSAS